MDYFCFVSDKGQINYILAVEVFIYANSGLQSGLRPARNGFLQCFAWGSFVGVDKIEFRFLFFLFVHRGRNAFGLDYFFIIEFVLVGLLIFFLQF